MIEILQRLRALINPEFHYPEDKGNMITLREVEKGYLSPGVQTLVWTSKINLGLRTSWSLDDLDVQDKYWTPEE